MASTWAKEPQEVVVSLIKPSTAQGSTVQETGKYPPEKDMPKWSAKWADGAWQAFFCAADDCPAVGDTIKVRKFFVLEGTEEKYPKWMLESDYQKTLRGKKGFGGGFSAPKPNLSPEQEIMDKAVGHAIQYLGIAYDKDGNGIKPTSAMLEPTAKMIYKIISEAGKKSEAPQA